MAEYGLLLACSERSVYRWEEQPTVEGLAGRVIAAFKVELETMDNAGAKAWGNAIRQGMEASDGNAWLLLNLALLTPASAVGFMHFVKGGLQKVQSLIDAAETLVRRKRHPGKVRKPRPPRTRRPRDADATEATRLKRKAKSRPAHSRKRRPEH